LAPATILFAHYGLDWVVGSERCLLDLMSHLDRSAFRSVLVCNSPTLASAAGDLGIRTYSGAGFGASDRFWPPRSLRALGRELLERERIELIHANSFEPVKWLLPAARQRTVPMVLHVHLPSTEAERCYSWAHQVASVVGVSEAAVRGFRDDGLDGTRIRVIYNGVDPRRLTAGDATQLKQSLRFEPTDVVIATVGSLIPRKAVDVVIEAAAELRARGQRGFRILSLGDGPELSRLQQLAERLGLADVVVFLGRRADAGAVMRDTVDIVVTAARQEAFPLNVLEAGFFGLPVVASDIAPHEESVLDERTGLLARPDDPASFADALMRLMADAPLRRRLGDAARERIQHHFIIDRYVQSFASLYEELLAAPHRRYGWLAGTTWPPVYSRWIWRALRAKLSPAPAPMRA
jgi:glycosyltransferase involved in cell wall biosynthesis